VGDDVTYLLSEPRMSDREKECAEQWLAAALNDDLAMADYWKAKGLEARVARIAGPGEEMPEPPVPEYKPKRAKEKCDLCGSPDCKSSSCLL
jgi:hypothetical protein